MRELQRINREKARWRRIDRRAQKKGQKLPDALSLAKSVNARVFEQPLNFSKVRVPSHYED